MTDVRVTKQYIKVLYQAPPPVVRVTKQFVKVLYSPVDPTAYVNGVTGSLTLTGNAGTVRVSDNAASAGALGSLSLTGYDATVSITENKFSSGVLGDLTLAAAPATVSSTNDQLSFGVSGGLTLVSYNATVAITENKFIQGVLGALTLTGFPANSQVIVSPGTQLSEQTLWYLLPDTQPILNVGEVGQTIVGIATSECFIGSITDLLPIAELPENPSGSVAESYSTDYYNHIHITTTPLALGNVFQDTVQVVYVWNAYLTSTELTSITELNAGNITISDTKVPPFDYSPLEERSYSITVLAEGAPAIAASYSFNFVTETATLDITGFRSIIWPYIPQRDFKETRQWLTDIVKSKEKEQRFALRDYPRAITSYVNRFRTQREFTNARALATKSVNIPVGLPKWLNVAKLPLISQGDSTILVDTIKLELTIEDYVMLWSSFEDFEVIQVSLVEAGKLTFTSPVITTRKDFALIPMLVGYFKEGVTFSEGANHKLSCKINHTSIRNYESKAWSTVELFDSLPIITIPSIVTGTLRTKAARDIAFFDNPIGDIDKFDKEDYNRVFKQISLKTDLEGLHEVRRQLDFMQGKFQAFWLPSFIADMLPTTNLLSGTTEVRVLFNGWASNPPEAIRIHGSIIENATVITTVDNGDGTESLGLSAGISADITNITSIQIMTKVRLNTDNVTYTHEGGLSRVKLPVVSVANE